MNAFGLAPLLLILPIIGVLFNGIVGRYFLDADRSTGEKWSGWFGTAMAVGTFIVSVLIFFSLGANDHHAEIVHLFNWFNIPSGNFTIPWAMQLDTLSSVMTLVVTGVGSLIHIYAIGYMHGDRDFHRFFTYLNLFLFFMLILVTGSSYLMLFVGWEGVGLCSFLLIGFWFDKPKGEGILNGDAARKAFVANRVGDFAMILGMILTFWAFGSMEYEVVFESALDLYTTTETVFIAGIEFTIPQVLTGITVLFLIGATGKSAQIPLFMWLPDAMAGPTPVSALIHAATMVTSGIYLIVRSNVLFEIVRDSGHQLFGIVSAPDLVAIAGAVTAVYAGLVAFTQFDIKKVLAYSTVSQLGFMIAAVGMGAYVAGMFHLVTHAFFKALLFMASGSVIHGMEHGHHHLHEHSHGDDHEEDDFDPQDMRFMGGLREKMPVTFWVYIIGSLALAGIFPFAGFWSKDEILAHSAYGLGVGEATPVFTFVRWMLTIGAFCTAFYMTRQIKMTFFGEGRHEAVKHVPESSPLMTRPLAFLAFLSLMGGALNIPYLTGGGGEEASTPVGMTASVLAAEEDKGLNLAFEHWLEHSIQAFTLEEDFENVVGPNGEHFFTHVPHTPTSLQYDIAISSTLIAVAAILIGWYVVFRVWPRSKEDPDPISQWPVVGFVWTFFQGLPLDTLYMTGIVKNIFNPLARFSDVVDWNFWHNFVHNNLIRDSFVALADFLATVLDPKGVDGIVNGVGQTARNLAEALRRPQTGNTGNYALSLFLGVALLVAFFVFAS
ncbi:MAG: NADH-quinone oxidoreductase subunit L [Ardenticatenaceae bacterium]|nr:NADH-quinone oxidoreductase subunit L [Ardenticatenaceae bacterium]